LDVVICLSGGWNLAHSKSAKKSIRIYSERRSRNRSIKSALKTSIGKAEALILDKETEPAGEAVKKATIALDVAAKKKVIHANNAARHKSRLVKKFNAAFPPKD
jgi:small subunit ribosomal protein S20